MPLSTLRVEILSPTLVEVTAPRGELVLLTRYFDAHDLLSMRQADSVIVEGPWRTVLRLLSGYDGDPWLSESPAEWQLATR